MEWDKFQSLRKGALEEKNSNCFLSFAQTLVECAKVGTRNVWSPNEIMRYANRLIDLTEGNFAVVRATAEEAQSIAEARLGAWRSFGHAYSQIVPYGGWMATGAEAADAVIRSAVERGHVYHSPIKFGDSDLVVGELEVVPGWIVVAFAFGLVEGVEAQEVLKVDRVGRYFNLDNRGTSWDPRGLNESDYRDGEEAPEGALMFAEFANSNNFGYKWMYPNPFGSLRNFSTTWGVQAVKLAAPEGVFVDCIMGYHDWVWRERHKEK